MARERQPPTPTTIKELYGTALFCAFPDCKEPLYRAAPDGGHILNSNVCHIKARREDGARWDPDQSEEENRSAGNLLLLCLSHHVEIDDLARMKDFPVDLLHIWKQRQIEAAQNGGYRLSDAEVEEVAQASFSPPSINMHAGTISVGGQGGMAPGAGGGGGGAIGYGARGGDGGPGGATRFKTSGETGAAPGAGGGGGGAIALSRHEWPSPATTVRASPKARAIANPANGGLRLTSLYLAEFAQLRPGLLPNVLGAGWERYAARTLPTEVQCALVYVIHMNGIDPGTTVKLNVTVLDPEGTCALEEEFTVESGPARAVVMPAWAITLRFQATRAGVWSIVVAEGSRELGWIPLEIRIEAR